MKKRIISILLCVCMVIGLLPMSVFAANPPVSIGGVGVDSADWYAKTDANGAVTTAGASASDWNVHVVTGDVNGTPTATVTLNNATIANGTPDTKYIHAIYVSGYDLNIVSEGTANQIGTVADDVNYGNAVYSATTNNVTITGAGDLTVKGNYGVYTNGSGAVSISTTGSLKIASYQQMAYTNGSLTASAKSIEATGTYFYGNSAVSLTATDGDISLTTKGSYNGAVQSSKCVALTADKGAVTIHHSDDASGGYALNGKVVTVRALNDVAITTSRGAVAADGAVSVTSQSGSIQMTCAMDQCVSAGDAVSLSAAKDVTLNDSGDSSTAIVADGKAVTVTAGGKLASASSNGFQVGALTIKANEVSVAGTKQDGICADSVAITNPNSPNGSCKSVSIVTDSSYSGRAAISYYGNANINVNIKADDLFICGQNSAYAILDRNTNQNSSAVTIDGAGLILGAVTINGTRAIDPRVGQADLNGGDASNGLDLNTTAPTQSTYYKAGNGYALFTPANGGSGTPAKLVLHNATIQNLKRFMSTWPELAGIALPAENLTLQVEGTNKISSYDGYGISLGANLTLSGDGTLTVEKTKCGISLENGSLAFAEGANVTLNSTVTTGDISHMASAVYGNVTVESTDIYNRVRLLGDVTITTGATLTVPEGQTLELDRTTSVTNKGQIVNNGRIILPYSYTAEQVQALNLSGSIQLYDMDTDTYKVYMNGSIYAYGGDANRDLYLDTPPTEPTYYSTDNGTGDSYIIFTPASVSTPAALTMHNAYIGETLSLPDSVVTLILEGKSDVFTINASNAVTVSGSGTLNVSTFRNSDSSAALTVNSGATLNTIYRTVVGSVNIDTIYGSYMAVNGMEIPVTLNEKLALAPGAVLTLADGGYLNFLNGAPLNFMTIGAGASIVNNNYVMLPKNTTAAQIAELPLSGTGAVRVATAYDNEGEPTTWNTYTNGGVALKTVSDGLDLTGGPSTATLDHDGYTWNGGTLTLGNACIDGTLTLPSNAPVVINTTADAVIRGTIMGDGNDALNLTFTGTRPLTISGGINSGINGDTVTVRDGAQVTVSGEISLGGSGIGSTLNVLGSGTSLRVSTLQGPAVVCDTANVQGGASMTAHSEGNGSIGVEAHTGVNITGGSTLTAGCDFGVYIIGGKLTVDASSRLITNAAVAPFCIVDFAANPAQGNVLSLANIPAGTQIASVRGTDPEYGYTYWSLVPTNGSLSVSEEYSTPVTLRGAALGRLSFVKAATPGDTGDPGNTGSTPSGTPTSAADPNKNMQTGDTSRAVLPAALVAMLSIVVISLTILRRRKRI